MKEFTDHITGTHMKAAIEGVVEEEYSNLSLEKNMVIARWFRNKNL